MNSADSRLFWNLPGIYSTDTQACARVTMSARSIVPAYVNHDAERKAAEASRDAYAAQLAKAGYGAITTEILPAPEFCFAEDYHQQYLAKNPAGYCGL